MQQRLELGAIVLAAGAGKRFSEEPGAKLLEPIGGQPMLARVLDVVRAFGPAATIVVLGHGADRIERAIDWQDELRVRNHAAELGLASSLQVGIDALRALPDRFDGTFIVLGDQPNLRVDAMRRVAAAAASQRPGDRPIAAPVYEEVGPRNPILLWRHAWGYVDDLEGDLGLAPFMRAHPDLVLEVPVSGRMPDVDRPADVAGLLADD